MRKEYLIVVVLASAALACRRTEATGSAEPAGSLPQVLTPLAGAQAVEQKVMPGHGAAVTYRLQAEYPALNVVNEIVTRAAGSGWEPLSEDFFNPGIPTSHVRGWTSYLDLSRGPQAAMHQWQSAWRNANGDLLDFSLWYRTEKAQGSRAPDKPDNQTLFVTGQVILKKDAEVLKTTTTGDAKRYKEMTSAMTPIVRTDPAQQVELMDIGSPAGVRHRYSISEATLVGLPEWQPEKAPPPLPMATAISMAREWAKKRHPKFDDLQLRNIQVQEIQCAAPVRNRWFYMLSFDPVVEGRTSWSGDVTVIVLMDGSIVTPTEKQGD